MTSLVAEVTIDILNPRKYTLPQELEKKLDPNTFDDIMQSINEIAEKKKYIGISYTPPVIESPPKMGSIQANRLRIALQKCKMPSRFTRYTESCILINLVCWITGAVLGLFNFLFYGGTGWWICSAISSVCTCIVCCKARRSKNMERPSDNQRGEREDQQPMTEMLMS